jgi:hypothetical protein
VEVDAGAADVGDCVDWYEADAGMNNALVLAVAGGVNSASGKRAGERAGTGGDLGADRDDDNESRERRGGA